MKWDWIFIRRVVEILVQAKRIKARVRMSEREMRKSGSGELKEKKKYANAVKNSSSSSIYYTSYV